MQFNIRKKKTMSFTCSSARPVLASIRYYRSKDLAIKHSSKPGAHRFPKFDGELKGIMEEHREGFYASGQVTLQTLTGNGWMAL